MVSIGGLSKGKVTRFIVLGIIVSVIIALNIPAKIGLGGGLISVVVLAGLGLFLRKKLGVVGVALLVSAGLIVGQTFIAPAVAGVIPSSAPAALTLSQMQDPVLKAFR